MAVKTEPGLQTCVAIYNPLPAVLLRAVFQGVCHDRQLPHPHPRCRHAQGEETEYIQNALKRGLQIFGFSDHTPQFFPGDYYSFMRMYPEELPDYCQTVRQLQEDYCGKLEIPLGLEAEYYPAIWEELLPRLQDQGIEYLILGQHWLDNEENAYGSGRATEDETLLLKYCRQVIEGMETGVFTYLAHQIFLTLSAATPRTASISAHFAGQPRTQIRLLRSICWVYTTESIIPMRVFGRSQQKKTAR